MLRDSPVMREISRSDLFFRLCKRRILPICPASTTNQDTMPKGGFGNVIALPLPKHPRESGCSVFVDSALRPHPDQWAFLAGGPAHGAA